MHDRTMAEFPRFIERLEGRLPYLYGQFGQVRVGVAEPVPTAEAAAELTFQNPAEDRLATHSEVLREWEAVHAMTRSGELSRPTDYAERTLLRLEEYGIDGLVSARTDRCAEVLETAFPAVSTWPADAQLAGLFITWFWPEWPEQEFLLHGAAESQDWFGAAHVIASRERPPNFSMAIPMFANAGHVLAKGMDVSELHYPAELEAGQPAPEPAPVVVEPPPLSLGVRDQEGWISVSGSGFTPGGGVTVTFVLGDKRAASRTIANEAGTMLHTEQSRLLPAGCDVIALDEATGREVFDRVAHHVPLTIPLDPVPID